MSLSSVGGVPHSSSSGAIIMVFSRGTWRIVAAGVLAAGFIVTPLVVTRADDDPAPRRRVKTLQERILEVQSGRHDQDLHPSGPKTLAGADLSDRERAVHTLNRLAFGPVPGQVEEVEKQGWLAWAKEQNDPEKINDSACEKIVAERYPWLKYSMPKMEEEYGYRMENKKKRREDDQSIHRQLPQLVLTRAVLSKRQFKEMMCEFWRNHFCVDQPALNEDKTRTFTDPDYEENVIRKYAFGNFKDMLFASARHPAMLEYLEGIELPGIEAIRK